MADDNMTYALAASFMRQLISEMPTTANMRGPGPANRAASLLVRRLRNLFFALIDECGASELLEIGSHDAEASVKFVESRAGRRAFAFEPIPEICERAAAEHEGKAIDFLRVALGRADGRVSFYVPRSEAAKTWGTMKKRADRDIGYEEIDAEMWTLATAGSRLGLDDERRSAVIWMDVEGAQLDVIEGGMDFIARKVAVIYTELYDNHVFNDAGTSVAVIDRLLQCGFIPVARDNQFAKGYNLIAVHREVYDACLETITRFLMDSSEAARKKGDTREKGDTN